MVFYTFMVVAEDIRNAVLHLALERAGRTFQVTDVAQKIDPSHGQVLIEQVNLVVESLVKEGKILVSNEEALTFKAGPVK